MKKVLLVGILALVVVGCVLAAGCTYDDDESMAQLAMGNLGAFSLGSGTVLTDEQLNQLDAALPGMIEEVNAAYGASIPDNKALVLKDNIISELGKVSRASGYIMDETYLVDIVDDDLWVDILLKEANHASGTILSDEQLEALGKAIEGKLGETSQASGSFVLPEDAEFALPANPEYVTDPVFILP